MKLRELNVYVTQKLNVSGPILGGGKKTRVVKFLKATTAR